MELNLLDEGSHVRQVRDSIEVVINETDSNYIVQTLLEDLSGDPATQTADSWHRRIMSVSKETVTYPEYQTVGSFNSSEMVNSPTIRRMSESIHIIKQNPNSLCLPHRPHTISASEMPASSRRAQISAQTFMPPSNEATQYESGSQENRFISVLKPPLPKRQQQILNTGF